MRRLHVALIAAYLAAIVVANLIVARWGQPALVVTATLLIPFDLVVRDVLQWNWKLARLAVAPRIFAVVAAGSVVTWLVSPSSGRVALASVTAFAFAGLADAVTFALLRFNRLLRINASNVVGATIDSTLFPTIAFGHLVVGLSVAQAVLKLAGGAFWSVVLLRTMRRT